MKRLNFNFPPGIFGDIPASPSFSGWDCRTARQASGGIRAEIVHLREVKDAVNELPPEVRLSGKRSVFRHRTSKVESNSPIV